MLKLSRLLKYIIIAATLIMLKYSFLLPDRLTLGDGVLRGIVACLGLLLAGITVLVSNRKAGLKHYFQWLYMYLVPYLIAIGMSAIYTYFYYGYTWRSTLLSLFPFAYILYAFPLVYIFINNNSCAKFLWEISILQIVMLCIKAIAWYTYNFTATPLFTRLIFEFGNWTRNGLNRVEQGQLFGLALVMATYMGVKKKIKLRYLAISVVMVCYVAFISMARYSVAVSVVTIMAICYFINRKGFSKTWVRGILIGLMCIIVLSGMVSQLVQSAALTGRYGVSTLARIQNIEHYFKLLVDGRRFFGFGLLNTSDPEAYKILYKSQGVLYYLDDIGILGGVVRFGILSLVVYGWLFVLTGWTCWKCYNNKCFSYFPLLIGISVYMISSCLLQNIYDAQRAYAVPFYLAVISYINAEISKYEIKK